MFGIQLKSLPISISEKAIKVQKLEPNQCSLVHVWDLSGTSDSFTRDLTNCVNCSAVLVTGGGLYQRRMARHLRRLRWWKFWNPIYAFSVGFSGGGGRIWIVRRRGWWLN
jgi:hypothetical protein